MKTKGMDLTKIKEVYQTKSISDVNSKLKENITWNFYNFLWSWNVL